MLVYFLFVAGFFLLIKGADWLVDGASSVAKKLKVSDLVIALTVVSFGTSAPELIVNVFASFKGSSDLAIANIVGSNISNTLLILGVAAVIFPLTVKKGTVFKEIPFNLLAVIVLWLMVNDRLIDQANFNIISRIDGAILVSFFIIFLYYSFGIAKSQGTGEKIQERKTSISVLMVLGGIAGLALGGDWIVKGAIAMATQFGMSEALIGLTIVAIGTSLPELAASAVAAYKKNSDIAIGNVVGSNIFNIFWILGVSSFIRPLDFSPLMNFDIHFLMAITVILFSFMFIGKKNILQR
ncbi:MAG: calcium/sodium antiporter, partial [Patescibacteria group bacterium]|nr:calcium/sodium antiporter [Patescibacteria group bacterium]